MFNHTKIVIVIFTLIPLALLTGKPVFKLAVSETDSNGSVSTPEDNYKLIFDKERKIKAKFINLLDQKDWNKFLMVLVTEDKPNTNPVGKNPVPPHIHLLLYNTKVSAFGQTLNLETLSRIAEFKTIRYKTCVDLRQKIERTRNRESELMAELQTAFAKNQCMSLKAIRDNNQYAYAYSDHPHLPTEFGSGIRKIKFRFILYENGSPTPIFHRKFIERFTQNGQELSRFHDVYFDSPTHLRCLREVNKVMSYIENWKAETKAIEYPDSEVVVEVANPVHVI